MTVRSFSPCSRTPAALPRARMRAPKRVTAAAAELEIGGRNSVLPQYEPALRGSFERRPAWLAWPPRMRFCLNARRRRTRRVSADHQNYATWPSNSPSFGMFFSCCGVIFADILTTRYTARSELSASDLVLREPLLLEIIARHVSPRQSLSGLKPKYGRSLAQQSP